MGMDIVNPLTYEIRTLYMEEYKVGLVAAKMFKDKLNIKISESEIGFITLHFHSARQDKKLEDTLRDTHLLKTI